MTRADDDRKNLDGEVAILRNQLSAFATELSSKRIDVQNINKGLEERMQRLDAAKKKYQATKDKLAREMNSQDNLEAANKNSVAEHKESENMMTEVESQIRQQKEILFKESQKLFKLRAEQADLIGAISGTISAKRNLQATINKLNQEKQRQQELLYKSEFQIAQMERTVARLMGERSMEDQKRIQAEIEDR
jgi:coiled-coil domain-containing protein 39